MLTYEFKFSITDIDGTHGHTHTHTHPHHKVLKNPCLKTNGDNINVEIILNYVY